MKDFTTGKEARLILRFATPMLLGNLFQQLYNIVDSIIVGQFLGKEALAAVGSSFPIIFTLISLIIGVATGGTIVVAQYFGAKNQRKVRDTIGTMYIFLFWAAIAVTLTGIIFSEAIFRLIQLPEELIPDATRYLRIYFIGMIGFFGFNAISAILRGLGDSKTPLYFLIVSTFFNIGFDLLFILVFKWGIAGAAIATVVSQGGAFITALIYLNRTHTVMNISLMRLKFDKTIFFSMVRIGLPTGFQHTFVSLGMVVIQGIVNSFGTNVIAAYAASGRLDSLAILPAMNFGMALSSFVGQNIGAHKPERIRSGLRATVVMSSLVSFGVTLVLLLFGKYLLQIFLQPSEHEVILIGQQYLVIVSSFYIVFSFMFTINGVLRGVGDTLIPMFITFFTLWVIRIPLAWHMSGRIGETGIWWSIPVSWTMGALLTWLYYRSGRWERNKALNSDSADEIRQI